MKRVPLDIYDDMPSSMKRYINNYGFHFTKKAYEYAVSFMTRRNPKTNREENIEPYTKKEIDELLKEFKVELKNKIMYDYVFVASMCKADFLGSSVPDEEHLALYIKDTVDDIDANDDIVFRRWMQTMIGNGIPIDWEEIY